MAVGYTTSRKGKLKAQEPLHFGEDGKFRILHISDSHKVCPEMDDDPDPEVPEEDSRKTIEVIKQCIEYAKPDLVVFGGDNVSGYWDEWTPDYLFRAIDEITEPVREKNIPFAIVFGNHDAENENKLPFLAREIQMSKYMSYDNFRGCFNEKDIHGCGNYHIHIYDKDNKEILWNVWCIDSNDYPRDEFHNRAGDGYDRVREDQIEWYESTVKAEKEKYGRTIPAILFQHIPVRQELDFIEDCEESAADYKCGDSFRRAKPGTLLEGKIRENPCPPVEDRTQFESWVKCGDIKAAFFGHDHVNTFRMEKDGISLYQTLGSGFATYGRDRGGRLIVLSDDGETIESETIVIFDEK